MSKSVLTVQLDKRLLDDAQRLVDAGEFDSLREVVAEALGQLLHKYDVVEQTVADHAAQHQMAARIVKGMSANLDPQAREQFDEFVAAYVSLTAQPPDDEAMVSLLETFSAFGFTATLAALHEMQHSKVALTPRYLMTILEKTTSVPANGHAPHAAVNLPGEVDRPHVRFSADNPLLADIARTYEQEIGGITEKVGEQLRGLVEEFPDSTLWHEAFAAAASMNKRSLRYVVGCLRGNGQKPAPKGTKQRGVSKSEQHRAEKRKRNTDYDTYWDDKLKAKRQARAAK